MTDSTALAALIETGDTRAFYDSSEWRAIRKEALARDRYTCQPCKDRGRFKRANTVHHRVEIKDKPLLALTLSNLQSVCHECHDIIHGRELSKVGNNRPKIFLPERW